MTTRHAPPPIPKLALLTSPAWNEYALLDSGDGARLEQFGPYLLIRPEPQAIWRPAKPEIWQQAHATFQPNGEEVGGRWVFHKPLKTPWVMRYRDLRFLAFTTQSRHVGLFPEQATHWDWLSEQIRGRLQHDPQPPRVLNLFGYTGLATLAASHAGAHVTHVDASKKAVLIARENQKLSGLSDKPIRWLVDDAYKFVRREERRGHRYEGLILDPPKFGRGPQGQVWEFFEALPRLLDSCIALLSENPLFIVLTAYAIRASALSIHYALAERVAALGGHLQSGELLLTEQSAGRLLSTAIFARWSLSGNTSQEFQP